MTAQQSTDEETLKQYLQRMERQHNGRMPASVLVGILETIYSQVWDEDEPWLRREAESFNLDYDREVESFKVFPPEVLVAYLQDPESGLPAILNLQKLSGESPRDVPSVLFSLLSWEGREYFEAFQEKYSQRAIGGKHN